jgi:hypothetical protein
VAHGEGVGEEGEDDAGAVGGGAHGYIVPQDRECV